MKKYVVIGLAVLVVLRLVEARGAGTNQPLIKATGLLTLPTNGTVVLAVSQISRQASSSFNVFGYNTATNYNATNWTVHLSVPWLSQGVSNDTVGKLVYLNCYIPPGTAFYFR